MEKILVAVNSSDNNTCVTGFAAWLASLTGSAVTGLFLENLGNAANRELRIEKKHEAEKNVHLFRELLTTRNVRNMVKRDAGEPVTEVIRESRYVDLIILDSSTSFANQPENQPTRFVKQVLAGAECPVVIAPQHTEQIEEIVFMYNGSSSSVFALKQFSYLFPQLDEKKVSVIEVDNGSKTDGRDVSAMRSWIKDHYSSIGFTGIKGDPSEAMCRYLANKQNTFVVAGAYGRGTVSRLFRPSTAEALIQTAPHAFFIAHR